MVHGGVDGVQGVARRVELRPPYVGRPVDHLPVQVAVVDHVEVDDAEPPDAGRGQVHRHRRAEATGTDAENAGRLQLQLPVHADLRHDQVPAVAGDLLVAQRRRRGDGHDRTPPATDGMMLTVSPSLTGVRLLLEEADVVVVQIDGDEAAQLAFLVVEVLAEVRVPRRHVGEQLADRSALGLDDVLLVRVDAQRRRNQNPGWHDVSSMATCSSSNADRSSRNRHEVNAPGSPPATATMT